MASSNYPLGKRGPIIGTPYHGTHTLGNWQSDNAVDIAVPVGTPVYAVADGVIGSRIGSFDTKNPRFAGLRLTVVANGNSFYYAHLSKLAVKAGEHVSAGQLVGYSGSANGVAHLHFAVQKGTPGDVIRGAPVPKPPPSTTPPPPPPPVVTTVPPPGVTPPNYMPPPVEPPVAASPPPELPGSQSYSLHNDGYQSSWQAVSQMPDLHPDTQRLLALSGVTNGG